MGSSGWELFLFPLSISEVLGPANDRKRNVFHQISEDERIIDVTVIFGTANGLSVDLLVVSVWY